MKRKYNKNIKIPYFNKYDFGGVLNNSNAGVDLTKGVFDFIFGHKINQEAINDIEESNSQLLNFEPNTTDNSEILSQWKNVNLGKDFTVKDIGKDGILSHYVNDKYDELQKEQKEARARAYSSLDNSLDTANKTTSLNLLANYSALGGPLHTNGANWTTGLITIDNGGTHEENPMNGVPMGMAPDGTPNLVEEGEVIWNNYVFSNRLKPTDPMRNKYKLKGKTFADAVKNMQKESEERPNDPISKRGLEANLTRLTIMQESLREKEESNKFKYGGKLYAKGGPKGINPELFDSESTSDYTKNPLKDNNKKTSENKKEDRSLSWLRYSPTLGSVLGWGISSAKPDYENADAILHSTDNLKDVAFTPIGNYLSYNPFDKNFYSNKLEANAAASRSTIKNLSNANRATAMAGLLASDYNTLGRMGDLARQAEEYNLAQREKVEGFNRGTNMFNSEGSFKADAANMRNAELKTNAAMAAANMREEISMGRKNSIIGNLTGLFDNIGNTGIDILNRRDRDMLIDSGVYGTLSQKPEGWSDKRWQDYQNIIKG